MKMKMLDQAWEKKKKSSSRWRLLDQVKSSVVWTAKFWRKALLPAFFFFFGWDHNPKYSLPGWLRALLIPSFHCSRVPLLLHVPFFSYQILFLWLTRKKGEAYWPSGARSHLFYVIILKQYYNVWMPAAATSGLLVSVLCAQL